MASLPQHVAVIMDGNNRWARARGKPGLAGHREGGKAVERFTDAVLARGVPFLTLFAFSSENWQRPVAEVQGLMSLFAQTLKKDVPNLNRKNVRLRVIGRRDRLSNSLVQLIENAERETANNTALTVTLAVDYGGRWDIFQATQKLVQASGNAPVAEADLEPYLALHYAPAVDLLIRTGGEQRVSNFMLWQSAYAELYFCDTHWPDVDEALVFEALDWYAGRERRFGKRPAPVESQAL